jgi:hypothetical protein
MMAMVTHKLTRVVLCDLGATIQTIAFGLSAMLMFSRIGCAGYITGTKESEAATESNQISKVKVNLFLFVINQHALN